MRLYSGGGKRLVGHEASPHSKGRGGKRLARRRRRWGWALLPVCGIMAAAGIWCRAVWSAPEDSLPMPDPEQPVSVQPEEPVLLPEQPDTRFLLSFAGDCTLGADYTTWGNSGTFPAVVGTNYAYPFSGVQELFGTDDFTFVNLECALTDYNVPAEKEYRFRGLPAYAEILKLGSVEAVTLANNHSLDYGQTGLKDTRKALETWSIAAGGDKETFLYTTERGLRIGVYTAYHVSKAGIREAVSALQEQGAQVIITAFHMGTEGSYTPTAWQQEICRYAAECGAHIVYNSHPHVLQPMEQWGDSLILYSMGNFSFGGNRNPSDKDTAVIQVAVELEEDGTARLDGTIIHPCSISSQSNRNDYRPTLYQPGSSQAERVESKLNGTYRPPVKASQPSEDAETGTQTTITQGAGKGTAVPSMPEATASSGQTGSASSKESSSAGQFQDGAFILLPTIQAAF